MKSLVNKVNKRYVSDTRVLVDFNLRIFIRYNRPNLN